MYKKFVAVWLCLNLVCPTLFAAEPFEDKSVSVEKSSSGNELETADISVKEETKEESKEESKEKKEEAKQVEQYKKEGTYISGINLEEL